MQNTAVLRVFPSGKGCTCQISAIKWANYNNAPAGICADYSFLIKFFRNLLLGEEHELKSRFLHVRAESTGQAQDMQGISAGQVTGQVDAPLNPYVVSLLQAIGGEQLSVREMMLALRLKGRDNFLKKYLTPALEAGYLCMLFPDSPRHPRQKYRITPRGSLILQAVRSSMPSL